MTKQCQIGNIKQRRRCFLCNNLSYMRCYRHDTEVLSIIIELLFDILARFQCQVRTSLDGYILTRDFHITIGCTDGNASKGTHLHITPWRHDTYVTVISTSLDTPNTVFVC